MYREWQAAVLHRSNTMLGEGPFWDSGKKTVMYVDIEGEKICALRTETAAYGEMKVNRRIGMIIPAGRNKLLMGLQGSIDLLDTASGEQWMVAPVEWDKPRNRCNDGKCDAAGRLWIGTMHMDGELHQGALYRYDGTLRKMLDNISVSNGICWSANNSKMYYIDSMDYNIKAFDFDLANGEISNESIIAQTGFIPDGMCTDEEGMLWVAMWGGGCVHRYHPESGEIIGKILVDAPHVTSCAFGGPDMNRLFITTARSGLTQSQLAQFPDSGSLFVAELPVKGIPAHSFSSTTLCI
ncbi:SMP-30/gluconolactonase/LRE family protein [Chitinophaga niabensis]|uniref:Sugar lactone lactonase YvrE n=1 Tax=Chitinophaga niabensis TaxID=536979 RepID=A0A1N6D0V9_9BACT|nr:SMP-30/gluconolactonase/LRE family protein [Chitinophaga niabensis]SIN64377.1 Sugar lactone lactonase YvrE [Chitinophaga niabensis]